MTIAAAGIIGFIGGLILGIAIATGAWLPLANEWEAVAKDLMRR